MVDERAMALTLYEVFSGRVQISSRQLGSKPSKSIGHTTKRLIRPIQKPMASHCPGCMFARMCEVLAMPRSCVIYWFIL